MKNLIILLISLLSCVAIQAQQKGDNTIVVKGVSFIQVQNVLLDLGYTIFKKDNDLQTVTTSFKPIGKPNAFFAKDASMYEVNIRVVDSVAFISARFVDILSRNKKQTEMTDDNFDRLTYLDKTFVAISKDGFIKLNAIAESLKGEISYKVSK